MPSRPRMLVARKNFLQQRAGTEVKVKHEVNDECDLKVSMGT